jgi:prolyl-tRNA synthetase
MRASQYFLPTLREVPAEAELASHRLLLRGGFIRKEAAGVYVYLPLGYRIIRKIEQIMREESNRIGGIELFMPALVSQELLAETGRGSLDILFRLRDRSDHPFTLGFTHEEIVTDVVRHAIKAYGQMPLLLYQMQTKFRDEPRPRGGLLRAREFLMYDGYSFHASAEDLDRFYQIIRQAYERIFQRMGLPAIAVEAEAGAIGGSENHEFMVIAEGGEDKVLQCARCGYAANAERCELSSSPCEPPDTASVPHPQFVPTPGARTVEEVTAFLGVDSTRLVKTLLMWVGGKPVAALVRGDRELNPNKLLRAVGAQTMEMMDAPSIERLTGASVGFAGPVGLAKSIQIIADAELRRLQGFVVGANQVDAHMIHVCSGRDFPEPQWADLRVAVDSDPCPKCDGGHLREVHGIEVGHIFQLGTKYSDAMGATFSDEQGHLKPILMGCYGLGISRCLAAIVETAHDADGIIFPITAAPFEAVLILVNPEDDVQRSAADGLYEGLCARAVEMLYDDRDERSGVKFKDADLIGIPLQIVVGRTTAENKIEVRWRSDKKPQHLPLQQAAETIARLITHEKAKHQPEIIKADARS